jgi:polyisoprenyl-teichoic acid--peptidoglycan teichoic acid transferase
MIKKIVNIISKLMASVLTLSFVGAFVFLFLANIVPLKYSIPILLILLVIVFFMVNFLFDRSVKVWIKLILNSISLVFIFIFMYFIIFMNNTFNFIDLLRNDDNVEVYYLISLKDSEYDSLESVNDTSIMVFDSGKATVDIALSELNSEVDFEVSINNDLFDTFYNLFNDGLSSLLIESSFIDLIEEDSEFYGKTRVIHEIRVDVDSEISFSKVNPSKESFNVYISGIDTYDSLSTVSRSDVNIILTINPITKEILITNIPRDYYVLLRDRPGLKDKLTHAGLYGVNTSIGTIEDLLDIDIHYYVKLNFTSVVDLVDDLGGITVNSKYAFTSSSKHKFVVGKNKLDGEAALGFVRERYTLPGGDRARGENQQEVIKAIIDKAINPSILLRYNTILTNLSKSFETNMNSDEIFSLVRMQLNDGKSWNITSANLDGFDGLEYTYSYGREKLYVMIPNLSTIDEAKNLISKTMN